MGSLRQSIVLAEVQFYQWKIEGGFYKHFHHMFAVSDMVLACLLDTCSLELSRDIK